jgi:hypothetical protein
MNFIQKISSNSDAQNKKTKKCVYIAMAEKTNKNRSQNIIKASAFYKIQQFFCFFLSKHFLVHEQNVFVAVNTCNNI